MVGIGQYPADMCKGNKADHGQPIGHVPFKPFFAEHMSHEGEMITSHYQHEKLVKHHGLFVKDRKHPDDLAHARHLSLQKKFKKWEETQR